MYASSTGYLALVAVIGSLAACTPGVGFGTGGAGGATSANGTTNVGPGPSTTATNASSSASSSVTSTASTGSGGAAPVTEYLYERLYPAAGVWKKTAIATAFPGDLNVPTTNIVSALELQDFKWVLWLTSDGMAHIAFQNVWQPAVPIDTAFPTGANCHKQNQHLNGSNCINDSPEPACSPLSLQTGFYLTHVPYASGCGGTDPLSEGITFLSTTTASSYTVADHQSPPSIVYGGQRDYLTDCSTDDPGAAHPALWAFQVVRPNSCPGDWYDSYVFRNDHKLYMQNAGDISAGTDSHVWPVDATNPLVSTTDPNQPDLNTVTAAYYETTQAKVVLIAP